MTTVDIDQITAEVVRGGLETIALEMRTAVMRTAYTPIVALGGDLSVSIADRDGRLVAQGKDIPAQLGAMPFSFDQMLKPWKERLGPGDVLIGNDPYLAGSNHINDVCLIMPAYVDDQHVGYVATRVHWTDIGGGSPGGYNPRVADMFAEGLRIPAVRMFLNYEPNPEVWQLILTNVRSPTEREWDVRAGFAGLLAGQRGLARLIRRHGADRLLAAMAESVAYSERRLRSRIEEIPDGDYHAVDWIEGDGWEERPMRLEVTVRVRGNSVIVDWTGTDNQAAGGVNMSLPTTSGIGVYAIRAAVDPGTPANAGMYAPVQTVAPAGTLVNPVAPAPCQIGVSETVQRAADLLMMALAHVLPDNVIAGTYASAALSVIVGPDLLAWRRRALGRDRTNAGDLAPGGMGARATKDGISGIKVHAGNTRSNSIEMVEFNGPLRVLSWKRLIDTGGAGRTRGGCAVAKRYRVLADDTHFTSLVERTTIPPFGLFGGRPGAPGRLVRNPDTAEEVVLPSKHPPLRLDTGEHFLLQPAGAGGYGPPWERPVALVVADVLDGYVSMLGALRDYGVSLRADGTVDEQATAQARTALASTPSPGADGIWDRGVWSYGELSWPPRRSDAPDPQGLR
jgi:N-methylhydantoinase B